MNLIHDERTVAEIVNDAIETGNLRQNIVAEEAGFPKPNLIYMFKTGKTKVPLDKAGKLAKALKLDPYEFWFKCWKEYSPETLKEFELVNKQPTLTSEEIAFILKVRSENLSLKDFLKDF